MSFPQAPPDLHQLNLLSFAADERTAAILDCIAGDAIHARDRASIVAAMIADAEEHAGEIDPDRVRSRLVNDGGQLVVFPKLLGALYGQLSRAGIIRFDHWKASQDTHGRNQSKPARVWSLVDREAS